MGWVRLEMRSGVEMGCLDGVLILTTERHESSLRMRCSVKEQAGGNFEASIRKSSGKRWSVHYVV